MGWNQVEIKNKSKIHKDIPDNSWLYVVHSYKSSVDETFTDSVSNYGNDYASSISIDNIFATQFHPEKSSSLGLKVLKNFCEIS